MKNQVAETEPLGVEKKYEEAGKQFRHVSTLRRTAIAFVFTATGASLALMGDQILNKSWFNVMLCGFNVLLVLGALHQDFHLRRQQKLLGPWLHKKENEDGPYYVTKPPENSRLTFNRVVVVIECMLLVGWLLLLFRFPI